MRFPFSKTNFHFAYRDFLLSREAALLSPATITIYKTTLTPFLTWLGAEKPTARRVREYLHVVSKRDLSDATVHKHARCIKTFLRFCHQEGYLADEVKIKLPKIAQKNPRVLTVEQVHHLLAIANRRDRLVLLLLIDTGLRAGEALALRWSDIDAATGRIKVRSGKGRKDRVVVVGQKTLEALSDCEPSATQVLCTLRGTPLKYAGLRMLLLRLSRRAGFHVCAHDLRRTFATLALTNGLSPLHLKRLMGHASLQTTELYVRLVDADLLEAHARYGPVDNL